MPIKSYLAHPHEGKKLELIEVLSSIDGCEIIPSKNEDLIVVVTETETKNQEDQLQEKLNAIQSLKMLSMVSGFDNPSKE